MCRYPKNEGSSMQVFRVAISSEQTGEIAMKTNKPLWMNEPDQDQTSIRFNCPFCFSWLRQQEFEQHIQQMHPQTRKPEQKSMNLRRGHFGSVHASNV